MEREVRSLHTATLGHAMRFRTSASKLNFIKFSYKDKYINPCNIQCIGSRKIVLIL
jgi:hypothetical protein